MSPDIDLIAVYRVIHGRQPLPTLTRAETGYAVHALANYGRSVTETAVLLGVTRRTVNRWRAKPCPLPPQPTQEESRWRDAAVCREIGPAYFTPPDEPEDEPLYSAQRAKAICASCPVRRACLDDAMVREGNASRDHRWGVWGGLTPNQRTALARARTPHTEPVPSRTEEIQARHRDQLLTGLRETA